MEQPNMTHCELIYEQTFISPVLWTMGLVWRT